MTKGVSKNLKFYNLHYIHSWIQLMKSKLKRTWRTQQVSSSISGRKFVSILMRFWYLTSARLPDDAMEGAHIFQVAIGKSGEKAERKRLLTANYEWVLKYSERVSRRFVRIEKKNVYWRLKMTVKPKHLQMYL